MHQKPEKMLDYERKMVNYDPDYLDIPIPPTLNEGEKQVIMIVHDETTRNNKIPTFFSVK